MSAPLANFGFSRNLLTVDFKNLTLNIEAGTTFAWDFGDGGVSNLKNPSHVYSEDGFFNVRLTSTTGTDISDINMTIGVGNLTNILNTSLLALTFYYLPSTLLTKSEQLVTLIQTWQMYLQPIMENPLVDAQDTHNEFMWPALSNKLIAMLVAKEVILKEATSYLANIANEGASASSSNTTSNSSPGRSIKSIETGPTKTEWYEGNDSVTNSETLKNIGASFTRALAPGGILELLTKAICELSQKLTIYLPTCGQPPKPVRGFRIGTTPQVGSYFNAKILEQEYWETEIPW